MENEMASRVLRAHVAARVVLCVAGAGAVACSPAAPEGDDILPALRARPDTMFCLADLDIPVDPAGADGALAMPETLSATGCFVDLPALAPAPDLVPYQLIAPLWTDGMRKQRFLRIPPGETVGFTATGAWDFPVGSVLIKNFILEVQPGDPLGRRPIETRFMIRAADAWRFHTYAWNEDGTEAHLLHDSRIVDLVIRPGSDGEEPETISYYFPDREACLLCHAEVTGVALGPRTAQLHRVVTYDSGPAEQIAAMHAVGLLRDLPAGGLPASGSATDGAPVLVDPADERAPLALRARSYLHGNCAHCHQPGGWNSSEIYMDMRYDTPFAEARLCGERIWHTIYRDQGELVIDPGDPDNSNLMQRMAGNGPFMMPPLGRVLADPVGTSVLRAWIEGMDGCP